MLQLSEITLRRGTSVLLEQATLRLESTYKVGVVGRNGAGKTSLFKLLLGELHEDQGRVQWPSAWQVVHLQQALPDTDLTAFEYVRSADTQWAQLHARITAAEAVNDGAVLAECYEAMQVIDGYRMESRVATLLNGLGFTPSTYHQPVTDFSGGWQMRLQLARVLLAPSDVLLLDEPTNHLDLETIMWLESWLNTYPGLLMVISHDRDFLDRVTMHTVSIMHQRLRLYQGNYSSFARQFQEALVLQDKSNQKIIKQQQHLQSFVDRFRAKATKAKQAQSRMKAIEKLSTSSDLQEEQALSMQFFDSTAVGYPAISIRADCGYGDQVILKHVELNVGGGDRIGVIGMNGSGKSTLLKSLAQALEPVNGEVSHHPKARIGYFSQQQLDMLHLDETPLAHVLQQADHLTETQARSYLGGFGFGQDKVTANVSLFSGGEKARLALALLIEQKPNVLVLDEPTNHLDMSVREALIMALNDFSGAVLLVSHDRYFIECCVNTLWWVKQGRVHTYEGDLSDYQTLCLSSQPMESENAQQPKVMSRAETKQLKQLEREIDKLTQQLKTIESKLADVSLYEADQAEQLQKTLARQQTLQQTLDDKEQQWFALSDQS
ncbi:MAG: ABC transporter ATP-binding protein [Coxiellaceae bacterium]|nr:ABC transporter ATP-binding protein [Coxiellaceae bacterium]